VIRFKAFGTVTIELYIAYSGNQGFRLDIHTNTLRRAQP
jgi:hypothetical protein